MLHREELNVDLVAVRTVDQARYVATVAMARRDHPTQTPEPTFAGECCEANRRLAHGQCSDVGLVIVLRKLGGFAHRSELTTPGIPRNGQLQIAAQRA